MRGELVLTNGIHTGKARTEAEGTADFDATFGGRRISEIANRFSGTPPVDRERWFDARAEARRDPQHNEHVHDRDDFLSHQAVVDHGEARQLRLERT
jgi:hypothetical protein